MATLDGIDIASYQESLVPSKMTTTQFIIVKATGGIGYKNPCFKKHADATLKAGKLLGCYHYAREAGCSDTAKKEAAYFAEAVKPYIGKAILVLDFEADAVNMGAGWAKEWLDEVYRLTGVKPLLYSYKSCLRALDWSAVAKTYKLWAAQYPDYSETGYQKSPWTDSYGFGAWKNPTIYQYTSSGKIAGYSGRLDLDIFYGDKAAWQALAKKAGAVTKAVDAVKKAVTKTQTVSKVEKMASAAETYAKDDSHGYSQYRRFPDQGTDFDCSSLMYQCAHEAGYSVPTSGTRYTGTMLAHFKAAGFTALPFSAVGLSGLKRGDILLNVENHTEMAIGGGKFAGAHIAETGGIDGNPGDQTGNEISICNAYVYIDGWDYVLRPPADGGTTTTTTTTSKAVAFRVSTDAIGKTWLKKGVTGKAGKAIRWIAIKGVGKYRVCTRTNGWLPWVTKFNVKDLENGCAGDGSEIIGVQIESENYRYAVRPKNKGWYSDMVGLTDTGGSGDNFAGDLANAIDGFRVSKA